MKAIIPTKLRKRISDKWGSGHFGAPRGDRTHNGIDYICPKDSPVLSPCDGKVTKLGYAYADDLSFRYIQITNGTKNHRIFYVTPDVELTSEVKEGDIIGLSQDLAGRYPEITPHIHYEIKSLDGKFENPEPTK